MDANINKDVAFLVDAEMQEAVFRTGKSIAYIISAIAAVHPEVTFSAGEWGGLDIRKKCAAITRIKATLASF